jgi:hypothetical protein
MLMLLIVLLVGRGATCLGFDVASPLLMASSRTVASGSGYGEIRTLKKYSDNAAAKQLLESIAACTRALMQRRSW